MNVSKLAAHRGCPTSPLSKSKNGKQKREPTPSHGTSLEQYIPSASTFQFVAEDKEAERSTTRRASHLPRSREERKVGRAWFRLAAGGKLEAESYHSRDPWNCTLAAVV